MLVCSQRDEERRDFGSVDIITAPFALGFENVRFRRRGVRGNFDGLLTFRGRVEGVDSGECFADAIHQKGGIGEETLEVRRGGRGEHLLDLFAPGEVCEDGGAFYGC